MWVGEGEMYSVDEPIKTFNVNVLNMFTWFARAQRRANPLQRGLK